MSTKLGEAVGEIMEVNIGLDPDEYEDGDVNSDIFIDAEMNHRQVQDSEEDIKSLAFSIKASGGLLQPIVVHKALETSEHGRQFELVSGHRRVAALRLLAKDDPDSHWVADVKAIVKDCDDPLQRIVDQTVENFQRRNLSQVEEAEQILILKEECGFSQDQICELVNRSKSTVSDFLTVMKFVEPQFRRMALPGSGATEDDPKAPKISWTKIKEIAAASRRAGGLDVKSQEDMLETAAGMSLSEFQAYARKLYKNPEESEDEAPPTEEAKKSDQKITFNAKPSRVIKDIYLPHVQEELKTVEDPERKKELEIRIDTMNWMLNQDGTSFAEFLKPWEDEKKREEEEEKAAKEGESALNKWEKENYKFIFNNIKTFAADPDPEIQVKGTMDYCLEAIKQSALESMAKSKEKLGDKWEEFQMDEGFVLDYDPELIPEKVLEGYKEWHADKKKKDAERAAANKKKAAERKAEKEKKEKEEKESSNKTEESDEETVTAPTEAIEPVAEVTAE